MENQNINQEQLQKQPEGWADITINLDTPIGAAIQFLNILNQRLCAVEDNLNINLPNGECISLSQLYKLEAEAQENKGE